MQLTTLCFLIGTILVLSIRLNESAPAADKAIASKPNPPAVVVPPAPPKIPLAGARTQWSKKLDPQRKKIFNDYKKIIAKKLHEQHKTPAKFVPKPDKSATQVVSGSLYHYLVKVPGNKYAFVTIAHQGWKKDQYGKEHNVSVRPQLYALTETKF